jgi:hypothetical protein
VDLKLGGIAAAVAFSLSLLIGLVSRSTMPLLIVWPLVFAAIFFVLFVAAKFLFNQFLPELLEDDSGSGSSLFPGSMVNIVEGDNPNPDEFSDAQGPGDALQWQASNAANAARPDDSDKTIDDISTLSEVVARNKAAKKEASTGMDQNMENGYTDLGDSVKFSQPAPQLDFEAAVFGAAEEAPREPPVTSTVKPAKSGGSGSSPFYSDSDDTLPDLDSMAGVFTASSGEESETADYSEPVRRRKSANRDQSLEGDFSPEDIAKGIRTVLNKDKEE